jgi:hypothetical protein
MKVYAGEEGHRVAERSANRVRAQEGEMEYGNGMSLNLDHEL